MVVRTLLYFVVPEDDRWAVLIDDRRYLFATEAGALRAAVDAAGLDRAGGAMVEIRVLSRDGAWRVEPLRD
ncbi:MAG: hypothetical protein JOY99_15855 [Sphingomonadaceae bacterium]|nr:hypothetical protein [Sphingomonadaceae bacterium]